MLFALLCRDAVGKKNEREKGNKEEGLSVVEFGRALEKSMRGGGDESNSGDGLAAAVFRVLDSDGDGAVSVDELERGLRPVLAANKKVSKNSNGVPPALAARAALAKHDADADGRLSFLEFRSLLATAAEGR